MVHYSAGVRGLRRDCVRVNGATNSVAAAAAAAAAEGVQIIDAPTLS